MLYKFKSKAAGDVIMTGPVGDAILRLVGREPAPKGIFTPEQMPGLVAALEAAVAAEERRRAEAEAAARAEGRELPPPDGVGLRQRAWPLVEMLRRAHAAGEDIVWGV
jgi:hypothetical protein